MKETKLCLVGPANSGKTSWFSPFQGDELYFSMFLCMLVPVTVEEFEFMTFLFQTLLSLSLNTRHHPSTTHSWRDERWEILCGPHKRLDPNSVDGRVDSRMSELRRRKKNSARYHFLF